MRSPLIVDVEAIKSDLRQRIGQLGQERKEIMGILLSRMCHFHVSSSHFLRLSFNFHCLLCLRSRNWRQKISVAATRRGYQNIRKNSESSFSREMTIILEIFPALHDKVNPIKIFVASLDACGSGVWSFKPVCNVCLWVLPFRVSPLNHLTQW